MKKALNFALAAGMSVVLAACQPPEEADIRFRKAGEVEAAALDEVSGLQASRRHPGVLWVHNDDGEPRVYAIGPDGADLGHVDIIDAVNVDWEDITLVPGEDRDLLVLADVGDNGGERARVWLYLVEEPAPGEHGRFHGEQAAFHWISLRYPDGPRDTESVSWDPVGGRLLFLSKRDQPPRLYALDAPSLLGDDEATLAFMGEVGRFRPPQPVDRVTFGERAPWVSQPTGLDISPDGRRAAVITYRSLYLFDRGANEDWLQGFDTEPLEILGPPRAQDEAISFGPDGDTIWVGSEGVSAPLWEFRLGDAQDTSTP